MTGPCISVVLPVYNEDGNIAACLRGLAAALKDEEHEILVCYDFDEDKTLPAIAAMTDKPASVKLVRNSLGRGVAFAIRAGLQAARGDVLVTTMADLSDPPGAIPKMARKIRVEGADVVSGSRYMKGGSQTGGPKLKTLMSRAAGLSLHHVAGVGTHDATTNFRAYSRRFIQHVDVESRHGFELALEMTVKAHLAGFKVDEVPSSWQDRTAGESRFKLWTWLPRYLGWYLRAMAEPLVVWGLLAILTLCTLSFVRERAPVAPYWPDEWLHVAEVVGERPAGLGWLFAFHNEHRIPLPKLIWLAESRWSNFDGRWGCAVNVLLMAASAAVLIRGLQRFRGQTRWSDAFLPLLFLHWGHYQTLLWPFQVGFTLFVFLVSLFISRILLLRRAEPGSWGLLPGILLVLFPLMGAPTFPFLLLLAPWTMALAWKDAAPARRVRSLLLPAASLLLLPLYFGYDRARTAPIVPDPVAMLRISLETLAGSVGVPGNRYWPASGWIAAAAVAAAAVLMLQGVRRRPELRRTGTGLLLVLAGVCALALLVGYARWNATAYAGFMERYITLFTLAPLMVFLSPDLCGRPAIARMLQSALVLPMVLFFIANRHFGLDTSAPKPQFNRRLLEDIRDGLPVPIVAARNYGYWCPRAEAIFEEGLYPLSRARFSGYRNAPAPAVADASGAALLADGRRIYQLPANGRASIPLPAGSHHVRIVHGVLRSAGIGLRLSARLASGGAVLAEDRRDAAERLERRWEFAVRVPAAEVLELTLDSGTASSDSRDVWMIVEVGAAGP